MGRSALTVLCALVFSLLAGGSALGATPDSFEPDNDNANDATYAAGLPAPQPQGFEVAGPNSRTSAKAITAGTPHGPHSLTAGDGTFLGDADGTPDPLNAADRDVVKFSLTQPSDIQLQTDSDIPYADTFLRLYGGNGRQIAFNDDIDGANSNYLSRINMTNLPAGTYYASVEQYGLRWGSASDLDSYSLMLLTAPTGQKFPPSIISPLRASGVAFAQFKYTITAVGSEPIAFTASGFPTGLELNGNTLQGIPTQTGTFSVTLTATGPGGTKSATLELTINAFGIITTVAGNGNARFSGDGGLAIQAELRDAVSVSTDAAGNFYIVDAQANRVRKVDSTTGIITTVAGGGPADSVNDGVAATFAVVSAPRDIAVNGGGDIFFCDGNHSRIRKIAAATGVISTVAGNGSFGFSGDGGPASNAQLSSPWGVAVGANGDIYIADANNNRVRKVDSAGKISTVAGNGTFGYTGDGGAATSATMSFVGGVAVSATGDLYIADYSNNVVRKVTAATGIITTIAGNGTAGYSGDGAAATGAQLWGPSNVALDAAGNILITDANNNAVRKVAVATGIISTIAGNGTAGYSGDNGAATAATLAYPTFLALDKSGNILISDSDNSVIRKVTVATGIISTVAGNGTNGLSGDGAAATAAMLAGPVGVGVDANGNILISDSQNNRLRRVAAATGVITTIAGGGQPGDGGPATAAALAFPLAVVVDKSGNLLIADGDHSCIRKVDAATGKISTVIGNGIWSFSGDGGPASLAALSWPSGLALDASGNLFIADQYNHCVRKVNAATGVISTIAGNGTPAFSGDGAAATGASLNEPVGLAFDPSGNLFIMDTVNNCVRKVAATGGTISTVAGQGGAAGAFAGDGGAATAASLNTESSQAGIALDPKGNILIADSNNNRIRRVDATSGKIQTVVGNGVAEYSGDGGACNVAGLNGPLGIALDSATPASLLIADTMNARIRKVGEATPPVITSALTATGAVNTLFNYRITATGHPVPFFSASDLPAGLVVQTTGLITGIPTESGSFDVPLIAINAKGKDEKTLRLTITNVARGANTAPAFTSSGGAVSITAVPNPAKVGELVNFVAPAASDAEGDKFTHTWDFGDGSPALGTGTQDTAQHKYTAAGLYTVVVTVCDWDSIIGGAVFQRVAVNTTDVTESMIISKAQFKFNFSSDTSTKDSLGIAGIVPFRKANAVSASKIEAYIGSLSRTYTLSSKGSGNGTGGKNDVFKLSAKTTGGAIDAAGLYVSGKYTMAIKSTNLKTDLSALGFVKGVTTARPIKVPILLTINGDSYLETVTVVFKSSEKSGSGAKLKEGGSLPSR